MHQKDWRVDPHAYLTLEDGTIIKIDWTWRYSKEFHRQYPELEFATFMDKDFKLTDDQFEFVEIWLDENNLYDYSE